MMAKARTRVETDSMGAVRVPADRYWGAQTQRSLENFRIGDDLMPAALIRALGVQKKAAALANVRLGVVPPRIGRAIFGPTKSYCVSFASFTSSGVPLKYENRR